PLAKKNPQDPTFTDPFDLFILAREHPNPFTQLNHPIHQPQPFQPQLLQKQQPNHQPHQIHQHYIEPLQYPIPPTPPLPIPIHPLLIFLTHSPSITHLLLFP
ncbi:amino acid--tRNA ligase-related protein, partial [Staphylococcus hominis]|uniref:amino acid--tRNA ligase-related protein n=1 Tax=Staphylococcus hominis TaxID=1290 RepID=UPI0028D279E8